MNRVWTEEELDILRRDRAAKVPVPVTAAKLGRPVPATYARARLIGTLVQPHQSWDELSTARLRELVTADPPMTDKRIAEELGRTVTQIRWKMQDLGLIGVRDLSKLAKITASETARPKTAKPRPPKPEPQKAPPPHMAAPVPAASPARAPVPARAMPPASIDPRAALDRTLKKLEGSLAERLKASIAESEAGMARAATDAIAEKGRIDQRLAALGKQKTVQVRAEKPTEVKHSEADVTKTKVETKAQPKAEEAARQPRTVKPQPEKPPRTTAKPTVKKAVMPAVQGVSQTAPRPVVQSPAQPAAPRIVVVEAPAVVRPEPCADAAPAQVSGRGGWKSVRRDPARIMAQAKAKAKPANRADAMDLAQAAQAAIERFIAERGVTRTETNGIQTIVSRLQARGYIVVRDGEGWVIDQRHRVEGEPALVAFAEARGITMDMAA